MAAERSVVADSDATRALSGKGRGGLSRLVLPFRRRRGRKKRPLVVRVLRGLAASFATITVASLVGNALTAPKGRFEPDFGEMIRVGDVDVHYEVWGDSGPAVIMLPGFAETTLAFSTTAPMLASRGYAVYAIDLPGAGYTYGGKTDLPSQAALVRDWAAKLGIGRAIVVGHSAGASVAGELALEHRDFVAGVVFAGGDALDIDFGYRKMPGWLAHSTWTRSAYRVVTRWTWVARRRLAQSCGSGCTAFDGEAGAELTRKWMRPLEQAWVEEQMLDLIRHPRVLHLSPERIRSIDIPRAIVWGEEDDSAGSLEKTRENLGNPPERIIDGAGHQVMMAAPNRFAVAVDELAQDMTGNQLRR